MTMQFIKPGTNFDFIGKWKIAAAFSCALILITIISLVYHGGPRYGVDFVGGAQIELKSDKQLHADDLREALKNIGIDDPSLQNSGKPEENRFILRTQSQIKGGQGFTDDMKKKLEETTNAKIEILSVDVVGPQVSGELRKMALMAIFFALLFIAIYISGRFEMKWGESIFASGVLIGIVYLVSLFNVSIPILIGIALIVSLVMFWMLGHKFALGAIASLIHDVIITVGFFSVLKLEFNLPVIAAILTIIGYSLNDTIIVFDRVRETIKSNKGKLAFGELMNKSINDTLSRTILTSLLTLISITPLYLMGSGSIKDFTFAMIIGIFTGTYSSIYVAGAIVYALETRRSKKPIAQT